MQFSTKKNKRVQINITSLIDVLFLLLIFFMVSSTFLEQAGIKLKLPEASQKSGAKAAGFNLLVTNDEKIYFNDEPIMIKNLPSKMEAIAKEIGEESLILKADDKVRYGLVVEVMDAVKAAGIQNLTIATTLKNADSK